VGLSLAAATPTGLAQGRVGLRVGGAAAAAAAAGPPVAEANLKQLQLLQEERTASSAALSMGKSYLLMAKEEALAEEKAENIATDKLGVSLRREREANSLIERNTGEMIGFRSLIDSLSLSLSLSRSLSLSLSSALQLAVNLLFPVPRLLYNTLVSDITSLISSRPLYDLKKSDFASYQKSEALIAVQIVEKWTAICGLFQAGTIHPNDLVVSDGASILYDCTRRIVEYRDMAACVR
jgi:hypothetical protein